MSWFFSDQIGPIPAITLIVLALVCGATDLWKSEIYNVVTYSAMVLGLVVQILLHGKSGVLLAAGGFATGFFPAFLLFALGGLGGGDVKLLGAIGTLAGPTPTTEVMIVSFLFGGLFAMVQLAWKGTLLRTFGRSVTYFARLLVPGLGKPSLEAGPGEQRLTIRFGLAICVAVFAVLFSLREGNLLLRLIDPYRA